MQVIEHQDQPGRAREPFQQRSHSAVEAKALGVQHPRESIDERFERGEHGGELDQQLRAEAQHAVAVELGLVEAAPASEACHASSDGGRPLRGPARCGW